MRKRKFARRKNKGILKKILAIFFIILGILGLILPVLPGIVFIILGAKLSSENLSKKIKKSSYRYKCHKSLKKYCKEMYRDIKSTVDKKDK